jgi:hypothetical protein
MTVSANEQRTGRIVLIVLGALLVLLALAPLGGGGVLVAAHATQRDADGYYASGGKPLSTPTYALASDRLDISTGGPDWLFREGRLGTVRITATGTDARPVFVGIAREWQLAAYLNGVAHDEVTDFDLDPFSVNYAREPGTATPAQPGAQSFWAEASSGTGPQTVAWPADEGSWAAVVMNADGTRDVRTRVSVAAKVPLLLWLGIGLLSGGGVLAAAGGALIFFGTRQRPRTPSAETGAASARPSTAAATQARAPTR